MRLFSGWKQGWLPSDMRLADQDVAPGREDWFARTRLNVIDWYPQMTLNLVCIGLLCLCTWGTLGGAYCAVAVFVGPLPVLSVAFLYRQAKRRVQTDHVRLLRARSLIAAVNAAIWSCLLGIALAHLQGWALGSVVALSLYCLMMTGLICFSIPFVGTLAMAVLVAGISAGLIANGGWAGALGATIVALFAHSLYSIQFNLYYMFATRRLRTRTLREANETVHLLLNDYDENSSDWLWQTDAEGKFLEPSRRFAEVACLPVADLATKRIGHLAEHGAELRKLYTHIRTGATFHEHRLPVMVAEEQRWWSISGRPLLDSDGQIAGYRGFASDITEARKAEEQIAFMAHYDMLTGLGNRAMFAKELERTLVRLRADTSLAVLYVDLDHFKSINDGYGHGVGDQVLACAARRLESQLGAHDIAARLGGDEFAVILTRVQQPDQVVNVAQRIVDSICEPMQLDRLHLQIGASVGIAFGPGDAETSEQLLRCADLALYHAKEQGRGCASVYDRDMHEAMQDRRQLTSDLRLAVSRGELELFYQPLVEVQTGVTQGYEALLRWHHPVRGMVSPADFIPIAEETGLIVPIGAWVIRAGLDELATWPEHLSLAVNLSPVQIRNDNLIPLVVQSLAASGVDPNRFELEITESVLLHDSEENVAVLHKLRDLGIRIALDDFGTGYSSLNYLRSFPFDKIKIDRSFVDQLKDRPENQAIVDAVVGLANNLSMATTAEGVENEEQLDELRRNGCLQAQGFYFQKPLPADELALVRTAGVRPKMVPGLITHVPPQKDGIVPEPKRANGRNLLP
jgi:diguanylate cyclase (GGDEF)-like protein/PAS domain S-box-containing protein